MVEKVEWIGQSFSFDIDTGQTLKIMVGDIEMISFVAPNDFKASCYMNKKKEVVKANYGQGKF